MTVIGRLARRSLRQAAHRAGHVLILGGLLMLPLRPAVAGPPYMSDDPEPTTGAGSGWRLSSIQQSSSTEQ